MSDPGASKRRGRVLVTGTGSHPEAYGPLDWALSGANSLIWGSSFLLIAVGLEALDPRALGRLRVVLGAGALALFPSVRRHLPADDMTRISIIAYTIPVVALLLGVLGRDERVATVQVVGVAIALAGG